MTQRTTLTLQDDVYAALRRESDRTGRPFKDLVNEAIRKGLEATPPRARPVELLTFDVELRADVTSTNAVLELIEGPDHR